MRNLWNNLVVHGLIVSRLDWKLGIVVGHLAALVEAK